jgi:hypothetical protein
MMSITMAQVAEFFFDNRAKNLPPSALAEVFDRLIWCFGDNGAEIGEIQQQWLGATLF